VKVHVSHVRRSRRAWLAVLLLPWLVARAVVPAGFMPVVHGGDVHLAFCGGMAGATGVPGGHAPGHGASDAGCPFALGAGAAPLPGIAAALPDGPATLDRAPEAAARRAVAPGPVRVHSPRAPPVLA
jgi:hypothetical protein